MVKLNVLCDCEQGGLELIASTRAINEDISQYDIAKATHFYGCSVCDGIYLKFSRNSQIEAGDLWPDQKIGNRFIYYQKFRRYEGGLTKEEIIKYARQFRGWIALEYEKKIIAMRQK